MNKRMVCKVSWQNRNKNKNKEQEKLSTVVLKIWRDVLWVGVGVKYYYFPVRAR